MSNEYYKDVRIAEDYDGHIAANQRVTIDDIPFYVELAQEAAARGEAVLELGCGTGRVTIPMAQAGAEVVGLDSASPMLDVARRKADALGVTGVTWVEGDMAHFELGRRFGLITIPFRSFMMLLTIEEQKSCLVSAREHLLPHGRLALNFFNPDLLMMAGWLGDKRGTWVSGPDRHVPEGTLTSLEYVTSTQELIERQAVVERDDAGAIIRRIERNLRIRYVFRYEFEHLLALCGFEVEALYGWFDRTPFRPESTEMVWVASRLVDRAGAR